ncbi:MAG TPA: inorganic pyrophosphatase [Thermoanaerobaculia bacterium]|nr:inorganic pyrophosphatase [Thermoanaerobaculia bacterium]
MSAPLVWKTHPWHGVAIGSAAPAVVTAYVEIVPSDAVKYEMDKTTGHLRVDRPQKFSSVCPTLYGFIPQTLSGERAAELSRRRTGREGLSGDDDPLDICVFSEKSFSHGDFLLEARPIGGLRVIDQGQADDKIVAVLAGDITFGEIDDVAGLPRPLLDRLEHYFLTYKLSPGSPADKQEIEIAQIFGRDEAHEVIRLSQADYQAGFAELRRDLLDALRDTFGP